MLASELKHHITQKNKVNATLHPNENDNDPKLIIVWNALKELKYVTENLMTLNMKKNQGELSFSEICKSTQV